MVLCFPGSLGAIALNMKLNIAWWQDKWADLVSGGIPPSCPQWNHEGCCKTQEVLQIVSIQNNNFGTFSQHCLGCPEETEKHKILVRLRLKQCSVVLCVCFFLLFLPAALAKRPLETGTQAWTQFLCASGPTGTSHQSGCSSGLLGRTLTKSQWCLKNMHSWCNPLPKWECVRGKETCECYPGTCWAAPRPEAWLLPSQDTQSKSQHRLRYQRPEPPTSETGHQCGFPPGEKDRLDTRHRKRKRETRWVSITDLCKT